MRKLLPRRPQKSCKGCLVTNRLYEALSDLTDRMARDLEPEQWPEELGKAYETLAAHDAADGSEPEGDGATVQRLRNQVDAARSLILHACDLMTPGQVGKWGGVRAWLEQDENDYKPFATPLPVKEG
jgi:hypothetical protein